MKRAKGGRIKGGRQGWVLWGGRGGVKMKTTVLEQQQQKILKKQIKAIY